MSLAPSTPPSPRPVDAIVGSVFDDRLAPEQRARLNGMAAAAAFQAGGTVFREGVLTPFLAVVSVGRVALRLHVPERGAQTLFTVEPGELLGWSAVVPPYRATTQAIALERTELMIFEAAALRALLAEDPVLAAAVLPVVLESVSDRLTLSWQQLLDLFGGGGAEPW